jgi:hypothetical protein
MNKLLFALLLFFVSVSFAQGYKEVWIKISGDETRQIYIDKNSIEPGDSNDVKVWVMQMHIPPLNIESVNHKIYKSKTEYLFNTKLYRYAILKIIYFDAKGRKIKSFDYSVKTRIPDYRYNYPIFDKSIEQDILKTIYGYYPDLDPYNEDKIKR